MILIVIMTIIITTMIGFLYFIQYKEQIVFENNANEFGAIATKHSAKSIEQWIDRQVKTVNIIAKSSNVIEMCKDPNNNEIYSSGKKYLEHIHENYDNYETIIVGKFVKESFEINNETRNYLFQNWGVIANTTDTKIEDRDVYNEFVQKIKDGKEYFISLEVSEFAPKQHYIVISVPIIQDETIGFVSVAIDLKTLTSSTVEELKIGETGQLSLIDGNGFVLSHNEIYGLNVVNSGGDYAKVANRIISGENHFHDIFLEKHKHYNAKEIVGRSDTRYSKWFIVFSQEYDEIKSSASSLKILMVFIILVVIIGVVFIIGILVRNGQIEARKEGFIFVGQELNKKIKEQTKALEDLSVRDSLTGSYNHNKIIELLKHNCCKYEKNSVLMIDLDFFKDVNDVFGHQVGDEVLRSVAICLDESIKRTHFSGRYGGEEFLVVLPNTNLLEAVSAGEKLRSAISELKFSNDELAVTASIGVSTCFNQNTVKCINVADNLLYKAKEKGRNRVEWESEYDEET